MVAMKAPYQCQNDHILDNSIEDYDLNCPFCTTIMHMKEVAVKKFKSKLDSYKFSKPRLPVAVQPTKSERVSKLQVKSTSQKMMKKEWRKSKVSQQIKKKFENEASKSRNITFSCWEI